MVAVHRILKLTVAFGLVLGLGVSALSFKGNGTALTSIVRTFYKQEVVLSRYAYLQDIDSVTGSSARGSQAYPLTLDGAEQFYFHLKLHRETPADSTSYAHGADSSSWGDWDSTSSYGGVDGDSFYVTFLRQVEGMDTTTDGELRGNLAVMESLFAFGPYPVKAGTEIEYYISDVDSILMKGLVGDLCTRFDFFIWDTAGAGSDSAVQLKNPGLIDTLEWFLRVGAF